MLQIPGEHKKQIKRKKPGWKIQSGFLRFMNLCYI